MTHPNRPHIRQYERKAPADTPPHNPGTTDNDDATADRPDGDGHAPTREAGPSSDGTTANHRPNRQNSPPAPNPGKSEKPEWLPSKFWDAQNAVPRLKEMSKSYHALERRLSRPATAPSPTSAPPSPLDKNPSSPPLSGPPSPPPSPHGQEPGTGNGDASSDEGANVPERAEDYQISIDGKPVDIEDDVRSVLHDHHFTKKQVEVMYELARDHVLPIIDDWAGQMESQRDVERLTEHFGGKERWQHVSTQLKTWAKDNIPEDVFNVLSSNFDGVLALKSMMHSREPQLFIGSTAKETQHSESALRKLISSPAYWRDRDPQIIRKVAQGYRQLYPEAS